MHKKSDIKIVDTSIILKWLLRDETYRKESLKIRKDFVDGKIPILVPVLLFYEVGNGLFAAVRKKRISASIADSLFSKFLVLNLPFWDMQNLGKEILEIALKKNVSFYDATYVALSKEMNGEFFTADKRLYNNLKTEFPQVMFIEEYC